MEETDQGEIESNVHDVCVSPEVDENPVIPKTQRSQVAAVLHVILSALDEYDEKVYSNEELGTSEVEEQSIVLENTKEKLREHFECVDQQAAHYRALLAKERTTRKKVKHVRENIGKVKRKRRDIDQELEASRKKFKENRQERKETEQLNEFLHDLEDAAKPRGEAAEPEVNEKQSTGNLPPLIVELATAVSSFEQLPSLNERLESLLSQLKTKKYPVLS